MNSFVRQLNRVSVRGVSMANGVNTAPWAMKCTKSWETRRADGAFRIVTDCLTIQVHANNLTGLKKPEMNTQWVDPELTFVLRISYTDVVRDALGVSGRLRLH